MGGGRFTVSLAMSVQALSFSGKSLGGTTRFWVLPTGPKGSSHTRASLRGSQTWMDRRSRVPKSALRPQTTQCHQATLPGCFPATSTAATRTGWYFAADWLRRLNCTRVLDVRIVPILRSFGSNRWSPQSACLRCSISSTRAQVVLVMPLQCRRLTRYCCRVDFYCSCYSAFYGYY